MSGSMNLGPEWLQVTSNSNTSKTSKVTTPITTTPTSLKLPLAAHRYGREEMLLFYSEDVPFPAEIAHLPTLTRKQIVPPLAISPLSPMEQQVLSGRVNSDSMRGRGGHSGRGRGGRGRGGGMGRPDYYRNPSGEEFRERTYHRSNSESDKTDERHPPNDKTSRAIQDTNWRSNPPREVAWVGKSWSTSSPVKEGKGNNVWGSTTDTQQGGGKKHWQPLPEWATTDTKAVESSSSVQNEDEIKYSLPPADKPPDEANVKDDDDLDIIEDVFETLPASTGNETTPSQVLPKSVRAPSSDSVEEMERRFEKAAEAILSTEDDDTPLPSPVPTPLPLLVNNTNTEMEQWLYQDPQGDTQGPFSCQEMNSWFTAGYFTMSLHVRRVSDAHMLPLGQVIRIWGRTPFISGPIIPPLQSTEPFWQQVFQQQHQLFPELAQPKPNPQPHPQPDPMWRSVVNKDPMTTNTATANSANVSGEDQWPDLGGNRQVQQHQKEEERKQKLKEAEEAAARQHLAELQRQREEEEIRKRYEVEQLRLQEEKRREEELRQLEVERLRREEERREEERRKREEERRRTEEECKRNLEIEHRLREEKQRIEEERLQHELYQRLQLEEQQRNKVIDDSPPLPTSKPHPPQKISLIDIQREEAREMALQQELFHQHQREQQQRELLEQQNSKGSLPWSSIAKGHTTKPKASSFLEIQQEQEQQGTTGSSSNNRHHQTRNTTVSSSPSGVSSWSKITAGNKSQPPPPWGGNNHTPQQPVVAFSSNPRPLTTPPSKEPQPMSFWEECAKDSLKMGKGRGRDVNRQNSNGRPGGGASKSVKEEEKVRQLFTATSPDEDFTQWCKRELVKYNSDVDAVTFVNLLLEVESTYEVHDYIKSFLGESDDVHLFAKQFLERRQKIRNYTTPTAQNKKHTGGGGGESSTAAMSSSSASRNSKKKKKGSGGGSGKMQKISPSSLLGFTVNAGERPNAGEIQSAKDAL